MLNRKINILWSGIKKSSRTQRDIYGVTEPIELAPRSG
jgi:hypothetical protein